MTCQKTAKRLQTSMTVSPNTNAHTNMTVRAGRPLVKVDRKAEKRLVRKIDLFVMPTAALIASVSFLDRSNIGAPNGPLTVPELHHG